MNFLRRSRRLLTGKESSEDEPQTVPSIPEGVSREAFDEIKGQLQAEKTGKQKAYSALVQVAGDLEETRAKTYLLIQKEKYANSRWHDGGLWRRPHILPAVKASLRPNQIARTRDTIQLSDVFLDLVVVVAFLRVTEGISTNSDADLKSLLYFAVFWSVWFKDTSYSSIFDTTDLSAKIVTLVTCCAVLFGSLSCSGGLDGEGSTRIMIMAAFVAFLNFLLHFWVLFTNMSDELCDAEACAAQQVSNYATVNCILLLAESAVWIGGIFFVPLDWEYRWTVFVAGLVLGIRIPRVFLTEDFHIATTKRGVLFILLLGFLIQNVVLVASPYFVEEVPTLENYGFIGAACFLLFCINLLYVDDSDVLAEDHALNFNGAAGLIYNLSQLLILLSVSVMGAGLISLTDDYVSGGDDMPPLARDFVAGGFSMTVFTTFVVRLVHIKRVPAQSRGCYCFGIVYVLQGFLILAVGLFTSALCMNLPIPFFAQIKSEDILLLATITSCALFLVFVSWMDKILEACLYKSSESSMLQSSRSFGLLCCCKRRVAPERVDSTALISTISPLVGDDIADFGATLQYGSFAPRENA